MKHWTPEDLSQIRHMLAERKCFDEIAKHFGKSIDAIKIIINRRVGRFIYCLDCNKPIDNPKGQRKRCDPCAKKFTAETSKVRAKINHQKNKIRINARRMKIRWGKNRELVLKRDRYKCVKCGMTREAHIEKWGKEIVVYNPKVKNRQDRKYIKDDVKDLITVCLSCQGRLRVHHRSEDYSMCGGKVGMKPETLAQKKMVRCGLCRQVFPIYYDPIKNHDKWRNQKCEHCGGKFNYTKPEEKISFN